jgi:hypothetical protein
MSQQDHRRLSKLRDQVLHETNPKQMLNVLLALDRMLVEVSMRIYNVPRRDQLTMRKHNRHLHDTVREHLPRLLKGSRRSF